MRFKDHSVVQVMVGLHRVGIVGLSDALEAVDEARLEEREAAVDLLLERLRANNYIPESRVEDYREALWREILRHRGEDFSAFFTEVPVTVTGVAGPERDELVRLLESVLAELELRPVVAFEPPDTDDEELVLTIAGEVVARGRQSRRRLWGAVHRTLSGW